MASDVSDEGSLIDGFLSRSLDRIVACLDSLTPDAMTWHPPATGANSVLAIAVHALANAEELVLGVVGGRSIPRERDLEFLDEGASADAVRTRWHGLREQLHATLSNLQSSEMSERRTHARRGEFVVREVLVVAMRHAAEHQGQAELTRDLALAQSRANASGLNGGG